MPSRIAWRPEIRPEIRRSIAWNVWRSRSGRFRISCLDILMDWRIRLWQYAVDFATESSNDEFPKSANALPEFVSCCCRYCLY